ncbi:histidinol-phosphate transaminase [Clostridium sp. CX1]|uniref:Histidinol-phosphate aminotransferase n=1 Tax=Clostridium tanneri TaxID=3037988 RepID=A0ABU4JX31_9CLOT|nr:MULTISPECIES: histidinol-phosphate transaminase [unclassified Clostridium]MCT8975148.1 histidinol-phosphate transaminase [Clostridium sp. CX1]MDW8802705.1 histidinol-phosphate transaminase [Clostridium sp. A1-XYC3]
MGKCLFRNEVNSVRPYVPGKPVEELKRELGLEDIEKLASNENPLGPSPKAIEAIRKEAEYINIYPESNATKVKEKLAEKYNLSVDNIVTGNGGEELLKLIAETFINSGDEAIMADTTFDKYASEVSFMGGTAVKLPLKNYKHDFEGFIGTINDNTKLIFICNPNNPTGNIATKDELDSFVKNVPEDVVIVLDEAYYDYAVMNPEYPDSLEILKKRPNTIILRTFSKVAGIAAVRIGYLLTSKEIADAMNKIRLVFSVNRLAQAAALGALEDTEHIQKTVELNYKSLGLMEEYFNKRSFEYIKSNANFIFVNIGEDSRVVFNELLKKGIIIRPGYLWGWDSWLRISTGTIEQTQKFVDKLDEVLNELCKNELSLA